MRRIRLRAILTSLCRDKLLIMTSVLNMREDLHRMVESTLQGIGKGDGKDRCQQVDIKLQGPMRINSMNPQYAASTAGRTYQIER